MAQSSEYTAAQATPVTNEQEKDFCYFEERPDIYHSLIGAQMLESVVTDTDYLDTRVDYQLSRAQLDALDYDIRSSVACTSEINSARKVASWIAAVLLEKYSHLMSEVTKFNLSPAELEPRVFMLNDAAFATVVNTWYSEFIASKWIGPAPADCRGMHIGIGRFIAIAASQNALYETVLPDLIPLYIAMYGKESGAETSREHTAAREYRERLLTRILAEEVIHSVQDQTLPLEVMETAVRHAVMKVLRDAAKITFNTDITCETFCDSLNHEIEQQYGIKDAVAVVCFGNLPANHWLRELVTNRIMAVAPDFFAGSSYSFALQKSA